ncbi:TetR family transcriptional regulator [Kribbella rubisoli]|uniref:TetR family transcriptional regulator n=1 Tax=Kribbella rubisoli TaxID=3075929 RepID=A0A4Q7WTL0_9ACTN|nr:TetR/AcrR family transcriptional regulator [Kribbella rubisoli]RZU12679.1 TetR family transcriptional regulator [Kribbella rubisoli]
MSTEGLRERKKRAMRQQLSDAAAHMFLEQGYDAMRVADVAEACGVSEKTVFNYFPSKEALVLDRLEPTADALRTYLADPAIPPVAAMLKVLDDELQGISANLITTEAVTRYQRFGDLIHATPSLRAYQSDVAERFADVAAEVLASRFGLEPEDPEPQVAAAALLGLWKIQFRALRTHLRPGQPIQDAIDAAAADVERAAGLIEAGLATLPSRAKQVTKAG